MDCHVFLDESPSLVKLNTISDDIPNGAPNLLIKTSCVHIISAKSDPDGPIKIYIPAQVKWGLQIKK